MSAGQVRLTIFGAIATVSFDRPEARNALTFGMYRQLAAICEQLTKAEAIRVVIIRGEGGAFAAGTDIAEFTQFDGADSGLAYEREIEAVIGAIETLPVPTIAMVDGPAMGGGLIIASACDFRVVSDRALFGVPIARTLGNCLSSRNIARLERNFGFAATRRMLLLGDSVDASVALACGFAIELAASAELGTCTNALAGRLIGNAPLTVAAARESIRRLAAGRLDDDDIVGGVYASADFREGVAAFLGKRRPAFTGIPHTLLAAERQP